MTPIEMSDRPLPRGAAERFYRWYRRILGPFRWERTEIGVSVGKDTDGHVWVAIPAHVLWKGDDAA